MFSRRQYELIRGLCLAGLRAPEANFVLARELIEIGEAAETEIAAADAAAREVLLLGEADRIKAARRTPKCPAPADTKAPAPPKAAAGPAAGVAAQPA